MTAGEVIRAALASGKAWKEIQALLKVSHPGSKAARDDKSCREQVAYYRSHLKQGGVVGAAPQAKPVRVKLTPANELLLGLFHGSETELAGFLLRHTHFIDPVRIQTLVAKSGSAAWFPNCVRSSNQHHGGERRGAESIWEGRKVLVCDNTKARLAFRKFVGSKIVMAGNLPSRIRGYHVAHIWGRVFDPAYFTAGWNLCLMPGFLKLFTEEQDPIELLVNIIRQAAFDLYFKSGSVGLPTPRFASSPGLDMKAIFPSFAPNLL